MREREHVAEGIATAYRSGRFTVVKSPSTSAGYYSAVRRIIARSEMLGCKT